jgi:hypothetical protein
MALGCIAEGPEKKEFYEMIKQAFEMFSNMFSIMHSKVREVICWVMARICEHYPNVFDDAKVAEVFIGKLNNCIKDKPRISNQCCDAF